MMCVPMLHQICYLPAEEPTASVMSITEHHSSVICVKRFLTSILKLLNLGFFYYIHCTETSKLFVHYNLVLFHQENFQRNVSFSFRSLIFFSAFLIL